MHAIMWKEETVLFNEHKSLFLKALGVCGTILLLFIIAILRDYNSEQVAKQRVEHPSYFHKFEQD